MAYFTHLSKWNWEQHRLNGPAMLQLLHNDIQFVDWKFYLPAWGRITSTVYSQSDVVWIQTRLHTICLTFIQNINSTLVSEPESYIPIKLSNIITYLQTDLEKLNTDMKYRLTKQAVKYRDMFTLFEQGISSAKMRETLKSHIKFRFRECINSLDNILTHLSEDTVESHTFTRLCTELFGNLRHVFNINQSLVGSPVADKSTAAS